MVHTENLDLLRKTVEGIKWHKEQVAKCEATLDELCVFDAEGNGSDVKDTFFTSIAAAFNGQKQLSMPINPRFSLSLFPMADESILVVVEEDGKAGIPVYVWSIENLASNLALSGYLEYFDGISEEDFITSVLIESLKY